MKKKKLTYNSLALGNLKNRKKQYTLLIIGIILSMTLSSSFTFFVSSAISSALETHNFLYGKQSHIIINTIRNEETEEFLNSNVTTHGYAHILGKIAAVGDEPSTGADVAWLEKEAKDLYFQSLIEGRMPEKENEIAIEKSALTRLGIDYKLNDKITFDFYVQDADQPKEKPIKKEYILVGILNDKRSNIEKQSWVTDIRIPAAFVMDNTEIEIGGKEALHLFISNSDDRFIDGFIGEYVELTRTLRRSYYGANDGLSWYVTGGYEIMYTVADTFGMNAPYLLILVFVAVLAVASNIGIVNAFSTNLKERKRQIGLLRSVGATRRQIINVYGKETFILCLICTPVSILISIGAVALSVSTFGENFVFKPSWWVLPLSAIISILIVTLSSFIPLFSASRITPMQAIRNISLNRKIRTKKIKTQKEFNTSKLLASRNIKLYKSKQVFTSIILAIAVFGSLFGFSLAGGIEKQNRSLNADYQIRDDTAYETKPIANYDWFRSGISENDVQEILSNNYVESIKGEKKTNGYIEVEELTDYLELCNYATGVYTETFDGIEITKENYEKYREIPIENTAVIEKANITSPILPLDFLALPEDTFRNSSETVLKGKINIDKLNSGEEVILVLPKTLELSTHYYIYEDNEELNYSDLYIDSKPSDLSDEEITILKTAELTDEFKVGQKIKLGWIMSNDGKRPITYAEEGAEPEISSEPFDHEKIEKEVTIGAIIYEYSGIIEQLFNGYCAPCVLTTIDGLDTFTKKVPYRQIEVTLKTNCTEEINEEITNLFDRIFADQNPYIESLYEIEKDNAITVKTMYIIITAVVILLFTMCGSMINNALTARIRESKKEIGTLRAVGASSKEISSSYIRQVLSVLGIGTLAGAGAYGLFHAIYTLIILSYGQTQDDYIITIWQTLIGIILLVVFCVLNIYLKVKKEMKHSIVENIREL
ncbi:MAG: FtsX-like permease family protein [Ruminococcaceae bacterium]|nr:FtsX-like permease family protein [Oscillospiraceae bacterium]